MFCLIRAGLWTALMHPEVRRWWGFLRPFRVWSVDEVSVKCGAAQFECLHVCGIYAEIIVPELCYARIFELVCLCLGGFQSVSRPHRKPDDESLEIDRANVREYIEHYPVPISAWRSGR